MTLALKIRRELRVCFSLKTQPLWVRIVKWIAVLAFIALCHDSPWFWPSVAACFVAGLVLHFVYRWQTRAWTRPWGGWNDVKSADGLR
jgi:hypothetical protein